MVSPCSGYAMWGLFEDELFRSFPISRSGLRWEHWDLGAIRSSFPLLDYLVFRNWVPLIGKYSAVGSCYHPIGFVGLFEPLRTQRRDLFKIAFSVIIKQKWSSQTNTSFQKHY